MNIMKCINCGVAMQRLQRHLISSLSAHDQIRLSRWINMDQTQLPLDTFICHPCFLLLNTETGEHERLLGHNKVCLGCGKSVSKIRHHNLSMESPLLAVLLSQNTNYVLSRNNYVCHVCWMRANRQAVHDSSRDIQELASNNNAAAHIVQVVRPPEPPPIPPVQNRPIQRENTTISLPNYKRPSITSVCCIFQQCRNRSLHLVPRFLKRILLQEHSFYIPRSCRVCETHLYNNLWHLLPQMNVTHSTFSAIHIEDIINILKSKMNILDFENISEMPNHYCHYWTGLTVPQFLILYNLLPLNIKKSKRSLAIYLIKLRTGESNRRLATLFDIPRSTLELIMKKVRLCLNEHFVPNNIGVNHITHREISERNLRVPEALLSVPGESIAEHRPAIAIFDGTYIYLQKSANYMFQKKTYSLHKYDNLVKPFLIVSCDGHIIDAVGPYAATQTDAEIMIHLFENENGPFRRLFRQNDVIVLDKGFRDAIPLLENCDYRVYKPESLDEGASQLTFSQANKSRKVTLCRWVVEIVNGRFKRDFKLFRHRYLNKASTHLMVDFRIAGALLNKFHPVLVDSPNADNIIQRALRYMDEPNHLGQFIIDYNINRRRAMFTRIDSNLPQLNNFPLFTYNDLILFALGPYQVKQARSYFGEHVRDNGMYVVEVSPELDHSQEMIIRMRESNNSRGTGESPEGDKFP
ncbi:uncharacterized protein LOC123658044 [Melitaea cinxia]|uniref:uncharacterized protein LOC123658044 n=1 Tax=Melitaea cinxia TaxID=113334 RepID=UPI001E273BD8|nr:uncharacterized protein LOC123658044 [Melitaea cinxia]